MIRTILGTAQWGWNIDQKGAFEILDQWLKLGEREIDAATNYPINKNPDAFRLSEQILKEYIEAHGLSDLKVLMKVGSLNNMRTPDINLSPSFLRMITEEYLRVFRENLSGIMIHWDNREEEGPIRETMEALLSIQNDFDLQIGLSGIRHPEVYARVNQDYHIRFDIQLKHNVFQSDYSRYAPLHDSGHAFLAYGINGGGIRLQADYQEDSTFLARGGDPGQVAERLEFLRKRLPDWNLAFVRPPVQNMNHLGLIHAALHPDINGVLLGVSSPAQATQSLDFLRNIEAFEYDDIYRDLVK